MKLVPNVCDTLRKREGERSLSLARDLHAAVVCLHTFQQKIQSERGEPNWNQRAKLESSEVSGSSLAT